MSTWILTLNNHMKLAQKPVGQWIDAEKDKRGWSYRDVAMAVTALTGKKMGHTTPARIAAGKQEPSRESLEALVRVFNTDPASLDSEMEYVFRMAGYPVGTSELDPDTEYVARRLGHAAGTQRDRLMRVILALLDSEGL